MTWTIYILSGCFSSEVIWFRIGRTGPGFAFKRSSILFSERYGYTKWIPLVFGWRLCLLENR
jgi:hypothetical protein